MSEQSTPLSPVPGQTTVEQWRKVATRLGFSVVVLVGVYVAVAYYLGGRLPAGTTVQGVDIGGLSQEQAAEVLEAELTDAASEPIVMLVGDERARVSPQDAGFSLDLDDTLSGVTSVSFDPRNMWARLTGNGRSLGVSTDSDRTALTDAVIAAAKQVERKPVQAAVVFSKGRIKTTLPEEGVAVKVDQTADLIESQWPGGGRVEAVTDSIPADLDAEDVEAFATEYAEPALSGAVLISVKGENDEARISPNQLSRMLSVKPDDENGELQLVLDAKGLTEVLEGALAGVDQAPRNATVRLNNQGLPEIVGARIGKEIDIDAAVAGVREILGIDGGSPRAAAPRAEDSPNGEEVSPERTVAVKVAKVTPEIDNDDADEWEVDAMMAEFRSEFPTGAQNEARTENIRVGLRFVDGSVVMPGEQFSLADTLAPINKKRGYRQAGVIKDGRLVEGIGGGLSQLSTTVLNTAWFSGVKLDAFTPHSYYISRYPEGREATISVGQIDNVWTNDTSSPIVMQAEIDGNEIVMRFWGDRKYTVESRTGERRNIVEPDERTDDSENCLTQGAVDGFTVTVTRDLIKAGDVVRTDEYTTTYQPSPGVTCKG